MSIKVILDVALRSGNDAFVEDPNEEVSRILHDLASNIYRGGKYIEGDLVDLNGNRVGSFLFEVSRDE